MRLRAPTLIAIAGLAAWLVIAVITWASAAPLGHDESQYAIAAREALAGAPPRWFYLSRGMNLIAEPGVLLGGSERALRFLPMVIGVGFLGATWVVARRSVSVMAAGVTLLVLAGARNIVRLGTDLLSDVPATLLLLGAIAVILGELADGDGDNQPRPRWRLMFAAPLLAGAMYVRYGSVVPIAVIVLAAIGVGWRTLARRPWPVIATAALFVVLLVPHFVQAQRMTGSPLGILLASSGVPQEHYKGEGLVTYLTSNPFTYYGLLIPLPLLLGLVLGWRGGDRRRWLVWVIGVGSLVAIGFTTHAQPRYILLSLALLTALGVEQILDGLARLPATVTRVAQVVALVALVGMCGLVARAQLRADDYRAGRMRGTIAAAGAIKADAAGKPCILIAYHYTQLEWYTGCHAPIIMDARNVAAAHRANERVYVVRDFNKTWVPAPQPVVAELPGVPHVLLDRPGDVEVTLLTP